MPWTGGYLLREFASLKARGGQRTACSTLALDLCTFITRMSILRGMIMILRYGHILPNNDAGRVETPRLPSRRCVIIVYNNDSIVASVRDERLNIIVIKHRNGNSPQTVSSELCTHHLPHIIDSYERYKNGNKMCTYKKIYSRAQR